MANKPKIQIKNFSGMRDDGVYYLEGMSPRKLNGQSILTASWFNAGYINETTSGFTDLGVINGMSKLTYDGSIKDYIVGIETAEIFLFHAYTTASHIGDIHTIATPTTKPDIETTTNSNVIYPGANNLGKGRMFKATGGSTTTIVVNGEDFGAETIPPVAGDRLYNITKDEEYTIDAGGVGTTTLTLVTGTACESDDYFILFDDNFKDFGTTSVTGNHFNAQASPATWVRQIKLLGDEYWILNGNYVASFNVDESTFSATAKQLPNNVQAVCFDTNQGNMLVGGDYWDSGKLMLWDTYSDGWLSILDVEKTPSSIRAYNNGWVVVVGNSIYFTDGYQIKKLDNYPDLEDITKTIGTHYNGIEIIDNDIVLNVDTSGYSRSKDGIGIYNTTDGWSFVPYFSDTGAYFYKAENSGALYKTLTNAGTKIFASAQMDTGSKNFVINSLSNGGGGVNRVASFYIKLPEKMKVNQIELNLAPKYDIYSIIKGNSNVTVSYSDNKSNLWNFIESGSTQAVTTIKNPDGVAHPAAAGNEVVILEGDIGGERTFISSIANPGEATETWTLNPALSAAPEDTVFVNFLDLKKTETKTVDVSAIPNNLTFPVSDFYSDKIFIEVYQNSATAYALDINSINIY